jgi:hypothetical protein
VAACTTTKSIYGIGWKPIFCIGSSNRYDLYNTKNEWFIVSVIADRHKKWNFENKKKQPSSDLGPSGPDLGPADTPAVIVTVLEGGHRRAQIHACHR